MISVCMQGGRYFYFENSQNWATIINYFLQTTKGKMYIIQISILVHQCQSIYP